MTYKLHKMPGINIYQTFELNYAMNKTVLKNLTILVSFICKHSLLVNNTREDIIIIEMQQKWVWLYLGVMRSTEEENTCGYHWKMCILWNDIMDSETISTWGSKENEDRAYKWPQNIILLWHYKNLLQAHDMYVVFISQIWRKHMTKQGGFMPVIWNRWFWNCNSEGLNGEAGLKNSKEPCAVPLGAAC
jgi:hypothetical protein